jgi:predicted MFS family arabinose efflux permease
VTPAVGAPPTGDGPARATRTAWVALAVLTAINLLNYLDRFVLPAVQDDILASELHPNNFQLGLLFTAFTVVYTVTAPFFGSFGDRRNRPRLLAAGVGIWSVFTLLSGVAPGLGWLLAARAGVGIGEAAYATIAPALIADYFPAAIRGRVLSIFYAAMPVGAALGYVVGGQVGSHYGWRAAFLVAGVPGIVLALAALRLPESQHRTLNERPGGIRDYLVLLKNRPYVLVILGYAAYTFGLGGISAWMPSFLQRVHHLSEHAAGNQIGLITVITGFAGALAGGWLGDRLLRRWREGYLWLSGASSLLAAPFAYLAFTLPPPNYIYPLFAAELLIFLSTGPINSSILSLVAPTMRAASMAMSILAIHILGDGPSPTIIGYLVDRSSMQRAVMIIPVSVAIGGLIWLYAAWQGERSPRRAVPT